MSIEPPPMLSRFTRWLGELPQLGTRWPRLVLVVALLVTLAATPGLLRLKLRTDGHALVSEDDPAVIEDNAIRREFGIEDHIVVLVSTAHTNGIYNSNTLQLVRDLTAAFKAIPGINASNIASLATEPTFRFRPGTLNFQPFLDLPTGTREQTEQLREDISKIRLYTGTIVAFDGRSTAILVGTPAGADRATLYEALRERIEAGGRRGDKIFIIGAPVAESLLGLHILEDLGLPRALLPASVSGAPVERAWPRNFYEVRVWIARKVGLLPIALGVMALVFYLSFRRVTATLLPLMEVGACLVFVFGLMGWMGVPVYLTTAVMPVILTAMGVSDEIYIFKRYVELLNSMQAHRDTAATRGGRAPSPPSEGGEGRGEEGRDVPEEPLPGPLPTPASRGEGENGGGVKTRPWHAGPAARRSRGPGDGGTLAASPEHGGDDRDWFPVLRTFVGETGADVRAVYRGRHRVLRRLVAVRHPGDAGVAEAGVAAAEGTAGVRQAGSRRVDYRSCDREVAG